MVEFGSCIKSHYQVASGCLFSSEYPGVLGHVNQDKSIAWTNGVKWFRIDSKYHHPTLLMGISVSLGSGNSFLSKFDNNGVVQFFFDFKTGALKAEDGSAGIVDDAGDFDWGFVKWSRVAH